tara:strand:+ start:350 stop:499 length:150 start_codon:yes stop_codon:yes gene_type:complete
VAFDETPVPGDGAKEYELPQMTNKEIEDAVQAEYDLQKQEDASAYGVPA